MITYNEAAANIIKRKSKRAVDKLMSKPGPISNEESIDVYAIYRPTHDLFIELDNKKGFHNAQLIGSVRSTTVAGLTQSVEKLVAESGVLDRENVQSRKDAFTFAADQLVCRRDEFGKPVFLLATNRGSDDMVYCKHVFGSGDTGKERVFYRKDLFPVFWIIQDIDNGDSEFTQASEKMSLMSGKDGDFGKFAQLVSASLKEIPFMKDLRAVLGYLHAGPSDNEIYSGDFNDWVRGRGIEGMTSNPEYWQDALDHKFSARLTMVRNALREQGWGGEKYGDLHFHCKPGSAFEAHFVFDIDTKNTGGGMNVTDLYYGFRMVGLTVDGVDVNLNELNRTTGVLFLRENFGMDPYKIAQTLSEDAKEAALRVICATENEALFFQITDSAMTDETVSKQIEDSRPEIG